MVCEGQGERAEGVRGARFQKTTTLEGLVPIKGLGEGRSTQAGTCVEVRRTFRPLESLALYGEVKEKHVIDLYASMALRIYATTIKRSPYVCVFDCLIKLAGVHPEALTQKPVRRRARRRAA